MQDEESAALDELKEKDKEAELKRQEVHDWVLFAKKCIT